MEATAIAKIETGRFPEVTAVLAGRPTQDQWFAFLSQFQGVVSTRRPYVLVVDGMGLEVPPPLSAERAAVEILKDRRVEMGAYALGVAVCVGSGLLRATARSMLTAAAPRFPHVILGNVEEARTWVRQRLVRAPVHQAGA